MSSIKQYELFEMMKSSESKQSSCSSLNTTHENGMAKSPSVKQLYSWGFG